MSDEETLRRPEHDHTFPDFALATERHVAIDHWDVSECRLVRHHTCYRLVVAVILSNTSLKGFLERISESAYGSLLRRMRSLTYFSNNLSLSLPPDWHYSEGLVAINFAVILTPISPSSPTSSQALEHLPISLAHPALLLYTSSSPADSCRPNAIHEQSRDAELSLAAIIAAWRLRSVQGLGLPDSPKDIASEATTELPDWAFLLGVVEDSENIHLIAHIPYLEKGSEHFQYASVLFDSLPYPSQNLEFKDTANFLRRRYQLSLALICLQRHIFRLTLLWEGVPWPASIPDPVVDDLLGSTPSEVPEDGYNGAIAGLDWILWNDGSSGDDEDDWEDDYTWIKEWLQSVDRPDISTNSK